MELIFFLVFVLPILFGAKKWVYDPFANGTRQIDRLKHPTLARTQRILRARNVKAREKELALESSKRAERLQLAISADLEKHNGRMQEQHIRNMEDSIDWTTAFREITRVQDEKKAAEKKALEEAAYEERRVRELEMWKASEAIRIQKFKEQQAIENARLAEEQRQREMSLALEKKEREAFYAKAQEVMWTPVGYTRRPADNESYGDRYVSVHAVNLRAYPGTTGFKTGHLQQSQRVTVDGWTQGEEIYGNDIWFQLKHSEVHGYGWIWSGAVTNQSTSGLPRINADSDDELIDQGEYIDIKDHNGRTVRRAITGATFKSGAMQISASGIQINGSPFYNPLGHTS